MNNEVQEVKSANLNFVLAIFDEARRRGLDAGWGRVEGRSDLWRVEVYGITRRELSDLMKDAARSASAAMFAPAGRAA